MLPAPTPTDSPVGEQPCTPESVDPGTVQVRPSITTQKTSSAKVTIGPQDGEESTPSAYSINAHTVAVNRVVAGSIASQPEEKLQRFPQLGETRFGFLLVAELGRGSFGRVYLARQMNVGQRLVVLKVGSQLSAESERLGQLQHPNIAPVYSFHRDGTFQAFCMPYLGPVTLGHVLTKVRDAKQSNLNGQLLSIVLSECLQSQLTDIPSTQLNRSISIMCGEGTEPQIEPLNSSEVRLERGEVPYSKSSYVDAVLWIVSRITEGLAAAHAHKIIHSDLKPANILVSQNGDPVLIDFGVSFDPTARLSAQRIGGTRPYMSPEQLLSLKTEQLNFDQQSDLYSLGVIFFELLMTRRPFDSAYSDMKPEFEQELAVRKVVPSLREAGRGISPDLESIVHKCLAYEAKDRYQTAEELREDLLRHSSDLPLKYAQNRSEWERCQKFVRRNKWWLSLAGCGVLSVVLAGGALAYSHKHSQEYNRLQAIANEQSFIQSATRAIGDLETWQQASPGEREDRLHQVNSVLATFRALTPDPTSPNGGKVRDQAASLLLSLGRYLGVASTLEKEPRYRHQLRTDAVQFTEQAQALLASVSPRASKVQLAWLYQLGRETDAYASTIRELHNLPARTILDHRTEGIVLMHQGMREQSKRSLQEAIRLDQQDYWSLFYQGLAHYESGPNEWRSAKICFDRCILLDPSIAAAHFNRGLVSMQLMELKDAVADFTHVIEIRNDWPEVYLNRANAKEGQEDFQGAIDDYTKSLDLGYPPTSVLLARSRLYRLIGEVSAAERDLTKALKTDPIDERGWITRGVAQLPKQTETDIEKYRQALLDFNKALELNPKSMMALQFIARVYCMTNQNEAAIQMLTEQLKHYPSSVDAWSVRATLYARIGDRRRAHADAERAERLCDGSPKIIYQLAGVYAMTSKTRSEDKVQALRHLAYALRKGFGMDLLADDRELDPIRSDAEFSRVVEEAKRFLVNEPQK